MEVIKRVNMDLSTRGVHLCVDAVQGDGNTRRLEISLTENGESWMIPDETFPALAFRKPDGTSGLYDKLPSGASAVTVSGSRVTVALAPQVLSVSGKVEVALVLLDKNMNQLAAFPFTILVAPNPAAGKAVSSDYYHYQNIDQVNQAIDEIKADVGSLLAKLGTAETKITILQEQTGTLRSDVTGLQEETAAMQGDIQQLAADGEAFRKSLDSLNETANYYGEQLQDHWDMLDAINTELPKKGDNLYREPGTDMLYLRCGTEKLSGVGIANNDGIIIQDTSDGTEYLAKLRIIDGYPAFELVEI